jgi:PhnB protein
MKLDPCIGLLFNGQCEEALHFYERCMEAKIEFMMRWGESPMAQDAPPDWKDKVLHARFVIGGIAFTGGDALPGTYQPPQGFSVLLSLYDADETQRLFDALAANGTVRIPLQETFWAGRFGEVKDQFGISWTLNLEK